MSDLHPQALVILKSHQKRLSRQQYKTLRGQILAGNAEGALKGMRRLLRRQEQNR